mgnify:CR=1 FL=1
MRGLIDLACTVLQTALAFMLALQRRLPARSGSAAELADHGTAFGLDATLTATSNSPDERRR